MGNVRSTQRGETDGPEFSSRAQAEARSGKSDSPVSCGEGGGGRGAGTRAKKRLLVLSHQGPSEAASLWVFFLGDTARRRRLWCCKGGGDTFKKLTERTNARCEGADDALFLSLSLCLARLADDGYCPSREGSVWRRARV